MLSILAATVRSQNSIAINGTPLPPCAYGCNELFSANYDCMNTDDDVASCFCNSKYLATKPERWGCDAVCATKAERDQIANFLDATCKTSKQDITDVKVASKNETASVDKGSDEPNLTPVDGGDTRSKAKIW